MVTRDALVILKHMLIALSVTSVYLKKNVLEGRI